MKRIFSIFTIFLMSMTFAVSVLCADTPQTIRLYTTMKGQRYYYKGVDWINFNIEQKVGLVEQARQGALKMNAVMSLPAEIYITHLDRMFLSNSNVRQIELGQAIQGVAVSLKDWYDGSDPDARIKEALTAEPATSSS